MKKKSLIVIFFLSMVGYGLGSKLHVAIEKKRFKEINNILKEAEKTDNLEKVLTTTNDNGRTPLEFAVKEGSVRSVNAIFAAIQSNDELRKKILFSGKGIDQLIKDAEKESVRKLVENTALKVIPPELMTEIIAFSVSQSPTEIVKQIGRLIRVHSRMKDAISLAIKNNVPKILELKEPKSNYTVFHVAASHNLTNVMEVLINASSDTLNFGEPLTIAVKNNFVSMFQLLSKQFDNIKAVLTAIKKTNKMMTDGEIATMCLKNNSFKVLQTIIEGLNDDLESLKSLLEEAGIIKAPATTTGGIFNYIFGNTIYHTLQQHQPFPMSFKNISNDIISLVKAMIKPFMNDLQFLKKIFMKYNYQYYSSFPNSPTFYIAFTVYDKLTNIELKMLTKDIIKEMVSPFKKNSTLLKDILNDDAEDGSVEDFIPENIEPIINQILEKESEKTASVKESIGQALILLKKKLTQLATALKKD